MFFYCVTLTKIRLESTSPVVTAVEELPEVVTAAESRRKVSGRWVLRSLFRSCVMRMMIGS
ncbi:hypothetical protein HanHA300_Chr12g0459641 [Helianthus annuus]|nr:hypothetical protein HanHA300_Chr12g0459641 [Helianthus annuus]KAJ0506701.1 hypothetical protein HanHA89_Chr12g0485071 [Helianthus annuus]KAJ0676378.1 hypothetical protein HanLR1_Chr12g0462071 [Helianthus annuus]